MVTTAMVNSSLDIVTSGHFLGSTKLDYLLCNEVSIRVTESDNNTDNQILLEIFGKDASWILSSAVIIFTMQTGNVKNLLSITAYHANFQIFDTYHWFLVTLSYIYKYLYTENYILKKCLSFSNFIFSSVFNQRSFHFYCDESKETLSSELDLYFCHIQ